MPSVSPRFIGPYRIDRELGRGGQAVVYLAEDTRLSRRVALKRLASRSFLDARARLRFRREADALARLDHPGICKVHDTFEHDDIPHIAMQFVEGVQLRERMNATYESASEIDTKVSSHGGRRTEPSRGGPASAASTLAIIEAVARALHVAHQSGLIHRDIKPENILIRPNGEPVLIDFGLARDVGEELTTVTQEGAVMGTPYYLAPEVLTHGAAHFTKSADVYALGTVLLECLTGERASSVGRSAPERAASPHAALRSLYRRNPELSKDVAIVIQAALESDPARRYPTALDFADDLRRVQDKQPVEARPVTRWRRLRSWTRRSPQVAASLAITVAILITGAIYSVDQQASALKDAALSQRHARAAKEDLEEFTLISDARVWRDLEREADEGLWPAAEERIPAMDRWLKLAEEMAARLPSYRRELENLRAAAAPYSSADRAEDERNHPQRSEWINLVGQKKLARLQAEMTEERLASLEDRAGESSEVEAQIEEGERVLESWEEMIEELERGISIVDEKRKERLTWRFDDEERSTHHGLLSTLCPGLARFVGEDGIIASVRKRREFARSLKRNSIEAFAAEWKTCLTRLDQDPRFAGLDLIPQLGLVPLGRDPKTHLEEFAVLEQSGPAPSRDPDDRHLLLTDTTGIVLVLIPGGEFLMGAQADDPSAPGYDRQATIDEAPPHRLTLAPYFLSKFEITQAQWLALTGKTPSFWHYPRHRVREVTPRHPVEMVSWEDARRGLLRAGLKLPTEAQWEYACRAGTTTPWWCGSTREEIHARRGGNVADRSALEFSRGQVPEIDDGFIIHAPVGSLAPNAFGLYDVLGNVWEWCEDGWELYDLPTRPLDGLRFSPGPARVFRGGTFSRLPTEARSSNRQGSSPHRRSDYIGIRAARAIDPAPR